MLLVLISIISVALIGHYGWVQGGILSVIAVFFLAVLCSVSAIGSGTTSFFHGRRPGTPPPHRGLDDEAC